MMDHAEIWHECVIKVEENLDELDPIGSSVKKEITPEQERPSALWQPKEEPAEEIEEETLQLPVRLYLQTEEEQYEEEEEKQPVEDPLRLNAVMQEEGLHDSRHRHGEQKLKRASRSKCPICRKIFRGKSGLMAHNKVHAGEKPFECSICKKRFPGQGRFRVHMKKCDRQTPIVKNLVSHQGTDTGHLWIPCSICKESFAEGASVDQKYPEAKPYICPLCKNTFSEVVSGQRGVNANGVAPEHGKESKKGIKCATCKNTFPKQEHLIAHLLTCQSDNPFGCCVCNKSFQTPSAMFLHARIHSSYECVICKKRFREWCSLVNHERFHHDRPFECSVCERRFTQYNSLIVHRLNIHENPCPLMCDGQFECSICKRRFTQQKYLTVHMQRIHASNTLAAASK